MKIYDRLFICQCCVRRKIENEEKKKENKTVEYVTFIFFLLRLMIHFCFMEDFVHQRN